MATTKPCAQCGAAFEAKRSTAKYCSPKCRKRSNRRPPSTKAADRDLPAKLRSIEEAVRAELERLERTETLEGQQAIEISIRMGVLAESGSAVAALSKELSRVMLLVRAGAVTTEDEVAKARRLRDEKLARARASSA